MRRRHPWLHRAQTGLHLASEQMIYRVAAGEQRLVVALSLADQDRNEGPGAQDILVAGTLAAPPTAGGAGDPLRPTAGNPP